MPLSRLNDGFEIELDGIAFGMWIGRDTGGDVSSPIES